MAAPKRPPETALWKAAESGAAEGEGVAELEGTVPLVLMQMSVFVALDESNRQHCGSGVPVSSVVLVGGSSGGHEGSESEGDDLELHRE
jgi:hypothetical protein